MSESDLHADLLKKTELVLGRDISSEKGINQSFIEFSEDDLKDICLLAKKSGILAVYYIKYRLKEKTSLGTIVSFYSQIIQQQYQ